MRDFNLVERWLPAHSEHGHQALSMGDERFGIFDAEDHPMFKPLYWNRLDRKPNCFGYAMDKNIAVNPGFHLKNIFGENAGYDLEASMSFGQFRESVRENLRGDGLKRVTDELFMPGHSLIALCFVDEAVGWRDYHFMRLDRHGAWSQINAGERFISWTDADDEAILNPAACRLAGLIFDGFYHVPKDGCVARPLNRLALAA